MIPKLKCINDFRFKLAILQPSRLVSILLAVGDFDAREMYVRVRRKYDSSRSRNMIRSCSLRKGGRTIMVIGAHFIQKRRGGQTPTEQLTAVVAPSQPSAWTFLSEWHHAPWKKGVRALEHLRGRERGNRARVSNVRMAGLLPLSSAWQGGRTGT